MSTYFHDMDELSFYRRFRLTKQTTLEVLTLIEDVLEFPNNLNNSVSPMNQLLTTLRFYASAGHLTTISDFIGMHTSTASRIIVKVSRALASLRPRFIKMPVTQDEIETVRNDFFNIASFPRVIGVIDGTHVRIQSPVGNDAEIYRNRKNYFSMNVQVICDATLHITDIVARWPGSTHDSTIFNGCYISARWERGDFPGSLLLGDSGYPLRPYFLTPLANPLTRAENLYNESHIRTRNTVERLFGNWKRRFPVLAYVLQNIARSMHDNEPPPLPEDINGDHLEAQMVDGQIHEHEPHQIPINQNINNSRNELINNYFANL